MSSGPTPPRPDDEVPDPLLTVLQQRLHSYGQAPPPGAWAAIRQQLPPLVAPRPWWRRPRRLLPLLALLLGLVAAGTLTVYHGQQQFSSQLIGYNTQQFRGTLRRLFTAHAPAQHSSLRQADSSVAHAAVATAPYSGPTAATAARSTHKTTLAQRRPPNVSHPAKATTSSRKSQRSANAISHAQAALGARPGTTVGPQHSKASAASLASSSSQRTQHKQLAASRFASHIGRGQHRAASPVYSTSLVTSAPGKLLPLAAGTGGSGHLGSPPGAKTTKALGHVARVLSSAGRQEGLAAATRAARPRRTQTEAPWAVTDELVAPSKQLAMFDSLALKPVALGLLPAVAGPVLVARPDSAKPVPRARRWSLLVLAGPTLSYRTLGPAPTLAAQQPDFARLERPALGLGAQVQVRRVLSGRWALALGLGYHEYATRLALSIIDSSTRTARSVHQRDVYRVLTLPVQFGYALGAPRGELAWALLVGAEPSWYLGGRSTEGSDCGCQQRVYPAGSASPSPYRSLSLALSLGLDLRYRLGGPASRWQWVVQPTARYVATPFVRSEAMGFTRRQPWSLGLLTGISWDLR